MAIYDEGAAVLEQASPLTSSRRVDPDHKPPVPLDWDAPPITPGRLVLWRPDPGSTQDEAPAIVVKISQKEKPLLDAQGNEIFEMRKVTRDGKEVEVKGRRKTYLIPGDTIQVQVLGPDREINKIEDGVRHDTDPRWTPDNGGTGVWRYLDSEVEQAKINQRFAELVSEHRSLSLTVLQMQGDLQELKASLGVAEKKAEG